MITTAKNQPTKLGLKEILVPIDFSSTSRKALRYAIPFARQFGGRITLIHVVEPPPYDPALANIPLACDIPTASFEKELAAVGELEVGRDLLNKAIIRTGTAFEVISEVAREMQIDLIVLTTHGYTGLKHVFVGSTAERVVRHAPCPVLVVREREREFTQ